VAVGKSHDWRLTKTSGEIKEIIVFFCKKSQKKNKHGGNGGFDGFDSGLRKSTLISGGEDLILMGRWRDSLN